MDRKLWGTAFAAFSAYLWADSPMSAREVVNQGVENRVFKVGPYDIAIRQRPAAAHAMRDYTMRAVLQAAGQGHVAEADVGQDLSHVGLVVWQAAFVLSEFLLQRPPFGGWANVRCVDIGTGTGVVAIALAKAGADVVAADLPAITGLAVQNISSNCTAPFQLCQVVDHVWGEDVAPLLCGDKRPDVITGSDIVYEAHHFPALIRTLSQLAAAHTQVYLAFRVRGRREDEFQEMLCDAGFAVEVVPTELLHDEHQSGHYRVIRAAKFC